MSKQSNLETAIDYPVSTIPDRFKPLILANPLAPIVEGFRFAILGSGSFDWWHLAYSGGFMVAVLFLGIIIFNRVEKTFMDTV